jgi:hypothetical protein
LRPIGKYNISSMKNKINKNNILKFFKTYWKNYNISSMKNKINKNNILKFFETYWKI